MALVHRVPIGAIIEGMSAREQLAAGSVAMAKGEWATALDEFRSAWSETESADALDGVGRALWWLNDPAGSLELRARAFALFRRERRDAEATAVALWLARQYRTLYQRTELADGWLARARSLLSGLPDREACPVGSSSQKRRSDHHGRNRRTRPGSPWRSAVSTATATSRSWR